MSCLVGWLFGWSVLLCRPRWFQTHQDPPCQCHPSTGIKGVCRCVQLRKKRFIPQNALDLMRSRNSPLTTELSGLKSSHHVKASSELLSTAHQKLGFRAGDLNSIPRPTRSYKRSSLYVRAPFHNKQMSATVVLKDLISKTVPAL